MERSQTGKEQTSTSVVSKITRNAVFLLLSRTTEIVFAVITISLLARYLGVNDYGDYSFVMAFVAIIITAASFGIDFIMTREIAKNKDKASSLVVSAIVVRSITFVIIILLISGFLFFTGYPSRIAFAIIIALLFENIRLLLFVFISVFRAFEKMSYEVILTIITQSISFGLTLFVIICNLGFIAIFIASGISYIVGAFLSLGIIYKRFFKLRAEKIFLSVISLIKESYTLAVGIIVKLVYINIDVLLLKAMKSSADVALFQAPHKLFLSLNFLPSSIVMAAFPAFSRFSRDSSDSLMKIYEMLLKIVLLIMIPITVFCFSMSEPIIKAIFSTGFIEAHIPFKIIMLTLPFVSMDFLLSFVLVSIGEQRIVMWNGIFCLIFNVLLDLLLIPKFSYNGAAVATLCAYFLSFLFVSYCIAKRLRTIPIGAVLKEFVCGGFMWIFFSLFHGYNLFFVWPGAFLVFLGTFWALSIFSEKELTFVKDFIKLKTGFLL